MLTGDGHPVRQPMAQMTACTLLGTSVRWLRRPVVMVGIAWIAADADAEGEGRSTALMNGNTEQALIPISRFENSLDAAGVRQAQSDRGKLHHRTPSLHG
jgi:hypothetical protein